MKTGIAGVGGGLSQGLSQASVVALPGHGAAPGGFSGAAAVAAYAPLVVTARELDALAQQLAVSNGADALAQSHASYARRAAETLASGDYQGAQGLLDTVAAFEAALRLGGGAPIAGAPTAVELRAVYDSGAG